MNVEAKRGDALLIVDGPAAAIYHPDRPIRITHRDAAYARGYWEPVTEPLPDGLPKDLAQQLAAKRTRIETAP